MECVGGASERIRVRLLWEMPRKKYSFGAARIGLGIARPFLAPKPVLVSSPYHCPRETPHQDDDSKLPEEQAMPFSATVTQIGTDGTIVRSFGVHEFLWPPSSGDQIALPGVGMGLMIARVAYVEHITK